MRALFRWIVPAAAAVAGCGGASTGDGGSGGCTPGPTATVTVNASGFTPTSVCVSPGGSVTFTNHDTVPHDIEAGMSCQELNLGELAAGQSKTVTFPATETCSFFDTGHSSEAPFQGTVTVTVPPPPPTGGGGGGGGM